MAKRIQGKHIKHSPNVKLQTETQFASAFYVKSSTPYISAIKKITKQLNKFSKTTGVKKYNNDQYKKIQYITVKGMGRTIERTLKIAMRFQDLDYRVDILTGSVQVLDEFEIDACAKDGDEEREYRKRMVSSIEARIWLKRE
ncbi:uncharacterized protein LODBEIA_P49180 [Lodderomyces beijingensis]|uniref:Uncharacterized protein n=1 Tax=Lodderomyces beijingensis TaxID=1775926 RepID=A0ABP0ZRA8_9ASCO